MEYNGNTYQSTDSLATTYEQIAWQISVDGNPIRRLLSFRLIQGFGIHHSFELRLYHTEIEDPRAYRIDKSKDLLGKSITAILGTQVNSDITRFTGIITEVGFEEGNGLYGEVVLKGYSPTILLEGGPHMRSFYNRNLAGIAGDVTAGVAGKLEMKVAPRFTGNIEYSVQHKESHFAYLNRLSAFYGEWFYYNGSTLCFGRPSTRPAFDLQYVRHLQNLKMNLQVVPMNFTHITYQHQDNQVLTKDAPAAVGGLDYYGELAVKRSDEVYGSTVKHTPWQHTGDQGTLERAATVNKGAAAAQTFAIEATSRHPAPQPGARIRIMFGDTELGEYLVTETDHKLDNVNNYTCTFQALPADIEVMPPTGLQVPYSDTQLATVVRNDDPQGIGRVRVQFQWQEEDSMTPWLRVMTPDAGSSGTVSKNRGFVFIPEVGDQVLVDFEEGNPDSPFVLGSVFHGKNGAGGGMQNIGKSITTRSGHTLEMNDEGDGTHIIIRDPGGNEIFLDTKGKNITITAPETMTFNAKNVVVNAGESITMSAGANISAFAGKHISIDAGLTITENAGKDYMLNAENITKTAIKNITSSSDTHSQQAKKDIVAKSSEGSIYHHAQKEVRSNSGENSNLH